MISDNSLLTIVRRCWSHSTGTRHPAGVVRHRRGCRARAGSGRRTRSPVAPAPGSNVQPCSAISQCTTETTICSSPLSAEDQRPVRPGAGERDVEMVAARLGREAASLRRPGRRPRSPSCGTRPAHVRSGRTSRAGSAFAASGSCSCQTPSISTPIVVPILPPPPRAGRPRDHGAAASPRAASPGRRSRRSACGSSPRRML